MDADDDRPVVRLSLPEKIDSLEIVSREAYRNPRSLLNFWTEHGHIQDPLLNAAFRALWRDPARDERQHDHG